MKNIFETLLTGAYLSKFVVGGFHDNQNKLSDNFKDFLSL